MHQSTNIQVSLKFVLILSIALLTLALILSLTLNTLITSILFTITATLLASASFAAWIQIQKDKERQFNENLKLKTNLENTYKEKFHEIEKVADEINKIHQHAKSISLAKWFQSLNRIQYNNEIEVEVKFIAPLLANLGWNLADTKIRAPINISAGRQDITTYADWVLYEESSSGLKNLLVIEAKAGDVSLDQSVINQARSYAFSSQTPHYMLTNGYHTIFYKLGISSDEIIFEFNTNEILKQWDAIQTVFNHVTTAPKALRSDAISTPPPLPQNIP